MCAEDNKVSHVDEYVKTKVTETIDKLFGNIKVSGRKKHKFPDMDIEFLSDWNLSLFMKYYIEESIDLFGEELSATVSSPPKKVLQNTDKSSTKL